MKALDALSLVDNPANQHAAAVIAKRMKPAVKLSDRLGAFAKRLLDKVAPPEQLAAELAGIVKDAETYEQALNDPEIWEKNSALTSSVSSILDDNDLTPDEKKAAIDAALSAYRDDIQSVIKAAAVCKTCGAVMKDGACPDGHAQKSAPPIQPAPGAEDMKTPQTFTDLAAANAHVAELTKRNNELEETVTTELAKSDPDYMVVKGLPEAQAAIVRKDRKDSRDRIAKLEAERLDDRRVSKAEKMFKGIISDDDAGRGAALAVVKCFDGVASDAERKTAEEFVTKLAAQHAEVVKELDGYEVGGAGSSTTESEARGERLEKAARELMKVDKALTLPLAIAKALANDPDLYDEEDAPEPAGAAS